MGSIDRRLRAKAILRRLPAGVPLTGVECGVAAGKLSAMLLRARPQLRLYMVDLWAQNTSPEYIATLDRYARQRTAGQWLELKKEAISRVSPFAPRGIVWQCSSAKAAGDLADGTLDFAFIDDDHSKRGCSISIEAWFPKVKPGGWIGGHDYNHPDYPFGVADAVKEFFGPMGLTEKTDRSYTWFVIKPSRSV